MLSLKSFILWTVVIAIGAILVSCERDIQSVSVEALGPLVTIDGKLEEIKRDNRFLVIKLEDGSPSTFKYSGGFPEKFYREYLILNTLKPGDHITLKVQQSELDNYNPDGFWPWVWLVGVESKNQVWLTPQSTIEWDIENRNVGLRMLLAVWIGFVLWLVATIFPATATLIGSSAQWLFTQWLSVKGWSSALILLLFCIPTARECSIEWKLRNAPVIKGEIVERKDVRRYFIAKRHEVMVRPESSNVLIKTDATQSTLDQVEFRWDGQSREIYLREVWGNPWVNLALLLGFGILAVGMAFGIGWAMRSELQD